MEVKLLALLGCYNRPTDQQTDRVIGKIHLKNGRENVELEGLVQGTICWSRNTREPCNTPRILTMDAQESQLLLQTYDKKQNVLA